MSHKVKNIKELMIVISLFIILLSFMGVISSYARSAKNAEKQATYIFSKNLEAINFIPHAFHITNVTVYRNYSYFVCYMSVNRSGLTVYILNKQGYRNFTEHKPIKPLAVIASNASRIDIDGTLRFAKGTYYILIYNPNTYAVKAKINGYCYVVP